VRPFRVDVPDAVLDDLRDRLARTRWPDQIPGAAWEYGTDLAYLRDLCDYWRDGFDWRGAEQRLNRWPQISTEIDGQAIHAIHARADDTHALPLLVLHGWPGSVAELLEIVEPLRHPPAPSDAFHVVGASLPGFGFSGPTRERGWNVARIAAAMVELMDRLGYPRFATLGGDWGATTSNYLARDHPGHLVGIYLTLVAAGPPHRLGRLGAVRRRARVGGRERPVPRRGIGLHPDPGHPPPDARLRPQRLARWSCRLDR